MAVRHATVMYNFDADPGSGEISIHAGDDLIVIRTDIGNGWWEGRKANGSLDPLKYPSQVELEIYIFPKKKQTFTGPLPWRGCSLL